MSISSSRPSQYSNGIKEVGGKNKPRDSHTPTPNRTPSSIMYTRLRYPAHYFPKKELASKTHATRGSHGSKTARRLGIALSAPTARVPDDIVSRPARAVVEIQ
jgi:hypothetical protein